MSGSGNAYPVGTVQFVVVDDHAVFAAGMASLLKSSFPDAQIRTVTTLDSALSAVSDVREARPDGHTTVVLLDLVLGETNGLEFLRATREKAACGAVRTIVLSGERSQDKIDQCRAMGAKGYVSKTDDPDFVIGAIRAVVDGREYFIPGVLSSVSSIHAAVAKLSPQLRRVCDLVLTGKSDKDIAREMGISISTVKSYTNQMYRTLGVQNRKELMAKHLAG